MTLCKWWLVPLLWSLVASDLGVAAFSLPRLFPKRREEAPQNVRQGLSVRRNEVLDAEEVQRMGYHPKLGSDEARVHEIVTRVKDAELSLGFNDSSKYLASHHFFRVKEQIEQTELFRLLQLMPKGALLHGHNTAMVSSQWFVRNVTYRDGLIMYTTEKDVVRLTFKRPTETANWRYVADLRREAASAETFDKQLDALINLYSAQPEIDYPDIDVVWRRFQNMFETVRDAIHHLPVFVDYHTQLLQELLDDNIMYAEIRTGAGELYDTSGRIYNSVEGVQILWDIVERFRALNPRFFGIKLIYTAHRRGDPKSYYDVNTFKELQ